MAQDAGDGDVIDLAVAPDVGITISCDWQRDGSASSTDAVPYVISGPPHVVEFLSQASTNGNVVGYLSFV